MKKILILHNSYKLAGGEDAVVQAEADLLKNAGHRVHLVRVSNDEIQGLDRKVKTFFRAPFDPMRGKWAASLVRSTKCDIVHVHNFFPLLTPAVHQGASDAGAAVVQTLHNFRLLCANALFLREGKICEKCLYGSRLWGVLHKCYRHSAIGSVSVTAMQEHMARPESLRYVNQFIALTESSKQKFITRGYPANKISVKPNFCYSNEFQDISRERRCLFVGRISKEKGVHVLIDAWKTITDIKLDIIGDGPERAELEHSAPSNVKFWGHMAPSEIRQQLSRTSLLIVPSVSPESFGLVVIEAFSAGVPVLASRIGALEELVEEGSTGTLFPPGNSTSLASSVRELFSNPEMLSKMGASALNIYSQFYNPHTNLRKLEEIYDRAIVNAEQMSFDAQGKGY